MRLFHLIVIVLLVIACNNNNKPDVSNIKVNIEVERFERDFFTIDTNNIAQGLSLLNKKHPGFYPSFINNILLINYRPDWPLNLTAQDAEIIKSFVRGYSAVNDSLQKKYKKMDWLKDDLEDAFRYVKHYYPAYAVPGVITFIGTFDAPGVILTPKYIGIGLQQFAGKNYSAYQDPEIQGMYPAYISRRFDKEYIAVSCIKAVVDDMYPDTTQSGKLIEIMIEKGKQWYLLDRFLPDTPDSLKTGYTKAQTEWLKENEGNIWGSIIQSTPDIYTMDQERLQNYIGESPNTLDMHEAAPGNIGQWVGWQIVKKFADKNEKFTVQQVLASSATKIFQEAKYKPK